MASSLAVMLMLRVAGIGVAASTTIANVGLGRGGSGSARATVCRFAVVGFAGVVLDEEDALEIGETDLPGLLGRPIGDVERGPVREQIRTPALDQAAVEEMNDELAPYHLRMLAQAAPAWATLDAPNIRPWRAVA